MGTYLNDIDATRKLLANPDNWIHWPILPLKKRKGIYWQEGIVLVGRLTEVLLLNMWAIDNDSFQTAKREKYGSIEEMLAAGWIVD